MFKIAASQYELKFTPLEFETAFFVRIVYCLSALKFTPLEFETVKTRHFSAVKSG